MKPAVKIAIVVTVCLLAGAAILTGKNRESSGSLEGNSNEDLPVLLDLGSDTCTPCRMMVPELAAISQEYTGVVNVRFIDVNENPDAAQSYGINLIPTQIILDSDGTELFRHEGFMSREDMRTKLIEFGYNPTPS
jgi:thioredoxin 1